MAKRLIISSGKLNRHGYRILPEGIRVENFNNNPVLLAFHEGKKLPIGRLEELQIIDGKLTGVPVFDLNDELGARIADKWNNNFIHACSISHDPIQTSPDRNLMYPGQIRETVIETDLVEVSMVTIPSDSGACRLSHDKESDIERIIPKLDFKLSSKTKKMSKINEALGLSNEASEEEVLTSINSLKNQCATALSAATSELIEKGERLGILTEKNKSTFEKLAAKDFNLAKEMIDNLDVPEKPEDETLKLSKLINQNAGKETNKKEETEMTFEKLSKENPTELNRIRVQEPEKYEKLVADYTK